MNDLHKIIYTTNASKRTQSLYLPTEPSGIGFAEVARFLENLPLEMQSRAFQEKDLIRLQNPALLGRYLDDRTRPFYLHHFLPLWVEAVKHLMAMQPHPKILDLGCGTGQTSLLLTLLGADVLGVDYDAELISICNKRKLLYESQRSGLRVNFSYENAFDMDLGSIAPLDGIYSLFAFNLMKPAAVLIPRLAKALRTGGRLMISDGNQGSLWKLIPSRRRPGVLSPKQMVKLLQKNGFKILRLKTHCIFPPYFFKTPPAGGMAMIMGGALSRVPGHQYFCISYTLVAEKVC